MWTAGRPVTHTHSVYEASAVKSILASSNFCKGPPGLISIQKSNLPAKENEEQKNDMDSHFEKRLKEDQHYLHLYIVI